MLHAMLLAVALSAPPVAPSAAAADPSRWHGFNLLNMFWKGVEDGPFDERDFQLVQDLGFNFVRLPLDYRIWTDPRDPSKLDEARLKQLDDAVGFGRKHQVHVCIALHRAPGYVATEKEPETTDLWREPVAQAAFAHQWAMFAARYRGIPASELSFNLVNEPGRVAPEVLEQVLRPVIEQIRAIDPQRPIIVDGREWGTVPDPAFRDVIQATRGYQPSALCTLDFEDHDRPRPGWPALDLDAMLVGSFKPQWQSPLEIAGKIPAGKLIIHVEEVSARADLHVALDEQELAARPFKPGPGAGEWKTSTYKPEWKIYQAKYDRDVEVPLPRAGHTLRLAVREGDWLAFSFIKLIPASGAAPIVLVPTRKEVTRRQVPVYLAEDGSIDLTRSSVLDRKWLEATELPAWSALASNGGRVFVGEFGVMNSVSHDAALAWMRDQLEIWKQARWGWALWQLYGDFGILDSRRADVRYEDFHGHKLDRQMLELLQRYR